MCVYNRPSRHHCECRHCIHNQNVLINIHTRRVFLETSNEHHLICFYRDDISVPVTDIAVLFYRRTIFDLCKNQNYCSSPNPIPITKNNNRNKINNNISNNISKNIYNKGSETKKYYEQLKTK